MDPDPFDDLLGLEEQFYQEGYQLGAADGEKAGRIEGRAFGLEKGFEKYVEAGRLHGRSGVWAARLPGGSGSQSQSQSQSREVGGGAGADALVATTAVGDGSSSSLDLRSRLPRLPENSRLEKHVRVLYALTEPASLATENTEDAVSDFDDRVKRAQGKVKIIERLTGEDSMAASGGGGVGSGGLQSVGGSGEGNIEDVSVLKARH